MNRNPLKDPALAYALADARERLMPADPAITSVGIGFGVKGGIETGEVCLQVGVEEKRPPESVESALLLPRAIRAPAAEVRVDVVPTGVLQRLDAVDLKARVRPAAPGYSIGHVACTAGTLGAVLTDRRRRRYILSNNHVLANENAAATGDAILQPGPADGGDAKTGVIARLHAFVPLITDGANFVDCALAAAERDNELAAQVHAIGTVIGTGAPYLGLTVRKSGRTTGFTTGRIRRVAVTARIHYSCGILVFSGLAETNQMSAPGDSGSLIVDQSNRAVGLLFAGSIFSTLMCPIEAVRDALDLGDMTWF
ncbi:MAG: serine protease [Candidatus Wallbacteria bacterium]|nr:serine protease [Candidatus Wallbacteria bacterium]